MNLRQRLESEGQNSDHCRAIRELCLQTEQMLVEAKRIIETIGTEAERTDVIRRAENWIARYHAPI